MEYRGVCITTRLLRLPTIFHFRYHVNYSISIFWTMYVVSPFSGYRSRCIHTYIVVSLFSYSSYVSTTAIAVRAAFYVPTQQPPKRNEKWTAYKDHLYVLPTAQYMMNLQYAKVKLTMVALKGSVGIYQQSNHNIYEYILHSSSRTILGSTFPFLSRSCPPPKKKEKKRIKI